MFTIYLDKIHIYDSLHFFSFFLDLMLAHSIFSLQFGYEFSYIGLNESILAI